MPSLGDQSWKVGLMPLCGAYRVEKLGQYKKSFMPTLHRLFPSIASRRASIDHTPVVPNILRLHPNRFTPFGTLRLGSNPHASTILPMAFTNLWKRFSATQLNVLIQTFALISIFFEGYDQGVMGGVNASPNYVVTVGIGRADGTVTDTTKQGGIVSCYYLGAIFGCFVGGWLADRIGRVNGLFYATFFCLIGGALQSATQNLNFIICARVFTGIGTGALTGITPVFISEVSKADHRGGFLGYVFIANCKHSKFSTCCCAYTDQLFRPWYLDRILARLWSVLCRRWRISGPLEIPPCIPVLPCAPTSRRHQVASRQSSLSCLRWTHQ